MLKLGASKSWPDTLEIMTGSREMDIRPMIRYFQPLIDYLKTANGKNENWEDECDDAMDRFVPSAAQPVTPSVTSKHFTPKPTRQQLPTGKHHHDHKPDKTTKKPHAKSDNNTDSSTWLQPCVFLMISAIIFHSATYVSLISS